MNKKLISMNKNKVKEEDKEEDNKIEDIEEEEILSSDGNIFKNFINIIRYKFKERKEKKANEEAEKEVELSKLMEELYTAGYILSRKYSYTEIMLAANEETAKVQGREIHGYMQRVFPNYSWLVKNDVFDIAADFAKKYNRKEIYNVIKEYDFENAKITIVHLPRRERFDLAPNFDFDKFAVLTQGDVFENVVHWIENFQWTDDLGYTTTKTLAACNFLSLGFTLWELPVMVLKDTVGMDKLFFEAKTTADSIVKVHEQLLKSHIYTKKQDENTINEKLEDMQKRYDQLEERHQYLIDDIRAGDMRNPEEKLKDFADRYDEMQKRKETNINWKKLAIGIIVVIILIFVVIGAISLFNPSESSEIPAEDIPETIGSLYNIYKQF